jgi:hypothetical protein
MKLSHGLLFLILILSINGCKKEKENIYPKPLSLPKVETIFIKQIGRLFKCTGTIIDSGNLQIIERGICWDTLPFPNINNSKNFTEISPNIEDKDKPNFTLKLKYLNYSTTYYVRAYVTNNDGTAYGNVLKLTTPSFSSLTEGDNHEGGIVGYIIKPGDKGYIDGEIHGIIAAENDLDDKFGYSEAFYICKSLNLNGFTDWYLPSENEFHKILNNLEILNFKENGYYRSSTWNTGGSPGWGNETYPLCFVMISKWNYYTWYDYISYDNKFNVRPVRNF